MLKLVISLRWSEHIKKYKVAEFFEKKYIFMAIGPDKGPGWLVGLKNEDAYVAFLIPLVIS